MMNFYEANDAFHSDQTWDRLSDLTPLDLSIPENLETLKRVLDVLENGVSARASSPLMHAHFAEIYDRKGYTNFDSFSDEHRNDSYNKHENVMIQVTYILNKDEHGRAFSKVKAEGEALKAKVTEENKAERRAALETQLAAAKEAQAQAEAQLKAL